MIKVQSASAARAIVIYIITLSSHSYILHTTERLEDVAGTLEELWVSYNGISSLDGLGACQKLRVLYMSNNQVRLRT